MNMDPKVEKAVNLIENVSLEDAATLEEINTLACDLLNIEGPLSWDALEIPDGWMWTAHRYRIPYTNDFGYGFYMTKENKTRNVTCPPVASIELAKALTLIKEKYNVPLVQTKSKWL